ncbi:MAG: hypothetical protein AAGD22_18485 [Verrucomicrobiota bacterium]
MDLSHPSSVALRCAALLTLLRITLPWLTLAITILALAGFQRLLPAALILITGTATITAFAVFQSAPLRCVVCRRAFFHPKKGDHQAPTPTFFRSRMLRMCLDIISKPSFACIHCGARCACRKSNERLPCPPAPEPTQATQSTKYFALWQKPPPATSLPSDDAGRNAIMRGYSTFRIFPETPQPPLTPIISLSPDDPTAPRTADPTRTSNHPKMLSPNQPVTTVVATREAAQNTE